MRFALAGVALAALLAAAQARADAPVADAPPAQPATHPREASLDEYRSHLQALTAIVEACAKARDTKACDPELVGQDDQVPTGTAASSGVGAERRLVRYGWLRVLLSEAREKDKAADKPANTLELKPGATPATGPKDASDEDPTRPPERTRAQLLQDAEARLTQDLTQTNAASAAPPAHAQERETMKQVLAGRDFRNLEETSSGDSVREKLANWLNKIFDSAGELTARAAWVGRLLVWGFILAVCTGLAWGLIQLERRWRVRLVPEGDGPAAGAASARDWQLWLEDARKAAAAGQWREAIHFVYWASISRLESRRLWPADRARTPREYLALVAPEDPRKAGLTTLTGSFERIWYGGRAAGESDYRSAEQLATGLISGGGKPAAGGGTVQ
jgi:hypothetical protein